MALTAEEEQQIKRARMLANLAKGRGWLRKPVITPAGIFESQAAAARHYGLSPTYGAPLRARRGTAGFGGASKGWSYI